MNRDRIPLFIPGCLLLSFFLIMAFFPAVFTSYGLKDMDKPWLLPSADHLLGTNSLGYDIFTELVYGTKETLLIGLSSSLLMLFFGAMVGMLSTLPGIPGMIFNGLINIFMMLPHLITLIVISAFVGHSAAELIILIALFGWVGTARNVRAQVIHLNSQPFIETCRIQGFGRIHIIFHHILPNLYDLLLFRFLLGVNSCIMMESTLSFLGIGDVYTPTWGTMVNLAYRRGAFMRRAYHYLLPPGICIMLLSLSFYFISMSFEARREQIAL